METKQQVQKLIVKLKQLQQDCGYSREATWKVFEELDLPFGIHMYIAGNWTKLGLK